MVGILIILPNIHFSSILFSKVTVDRTERNPGPNNHNIKKALIETYYPGNEKLAETVDMQCMSNAFFLFLFEYLKLF